MVDMTARAEKLTVQLLLFLARRAIWIEWTERLELAQAEWQTVKQMAEQL